MRAWLLALAVLATGCFDDYAHLSRVNAPGNVPDLDAPLPHENGDPKREEEPVDPGYEQTIVWVDPYVLWGRGRDGHSDSESGLALRVEHHSRRGGDDLFDRTTLIGTFGAALDQTRARQSTLWPGPVFAEVGARVFAYEALPLELGAGPVVYPNDHAYGVQATARFLMAFPLRVRYTNDGAFEIMAGFEIPFPITFERSH